MVKNSPPGGEFHTTRSKARPNHAFENVLPKKINESIA